MQRLLIATTNPGKIAELLALLNDLPVEVITPADLDLNIDVQETGRSYAENAAIKAIAYYQASGLPVIADDSGLEVDVLGGAPGIYSARFSPLPKATDQDRRQYLLSQLAPFPQPWKARFRCVVALAVTGPAVHLVEGVCEGEITPQERGSGGFGYDPVFLVGNLGLTMAELQMEEKNRLSHRALAVRAAWPALDTWLSQST